MPYFIRKTSTQNYLHVSADSEGLYLVWTSMLNASSFDSYSEAKEFFDSRLKERYPNENAFIEENE